MVEKQRSKTKFTLEHTADVSVGLKLWNAAKGNSTFLHVGYAIMASEFETKGIFKGGCIMVETYNNNKMIRFFLSILLLGLTNVATYAQDAIIFRDGRVKSVKIIQTNNDKTLFKKSGNKNASEEYVRIRKVFMLKLREHVVTLCSMLMASAYSPPQNIRKYQKMQSSYITRMEEKFLPII